MKLKFRAALVHLVLIAISSPLTVPASSRLHYASVRQSSISQVAKPSISPSPSPTPAIQTPSPSPWPTPQTLSKPGNGARSLSELQNRIREVLQKPELSSALVAVKVASLDTNRVLFEENASKLLRPASNMKMYTIAAALDRLTPDFRFTTSAYSNSRPDSAGVLKGDLTILGRGDPSMAARFNNGDYFKGIDDLATKISSSGVKRIEGDLIGDDSYFVGPQYGSGWEWEDLTWYYGAEISALTVNDNALDLFIKPGPQVGSVATITTGPPDPLLVITNQVVTSAKGTRRSITVYRGLGKDSVVISGSIPVDDRGYTGGIGISHPALLFIYLLRSALSKQGVVITGKSRLIGPSDHSPVTSVALNKLTAAPVQKPLAPPIEIATFQSPPFSRVAAQTLKPSQNLYTELILRTLGKMAPLASTVDGSETSEELGIEVVKGFISNAGVRPDSLVLNDGSGLSRNDMITAEASVQLLTFMSKHRYADVFRDALPIAGVDGTLRNRFKGTAAEGNLRAKTGSLSSAASLSGYVTSGSGEHLVFSIMVNNYPSDVEPRLVCIDPIAVMLASFAGRSQ